MLSIVIPCYNEEKIIYKIRNEYNNLSQDDKILIKEIIFVIDGSIDNTELTIIEEFKNCNIKILVINIVNNIGKDRAIIEGVKYAERKVSFRSYPFGVTLPVTLNAFRIYRIR